MDSKKLKKIVEAIIFVSEEPISAKEISDVLSIDEDEIKEVITDLISDYRGRGIEIESIADGFRFTTSEDVSEYVKIFVQDRPIKLSKH